MLYCMALTTSELEFLSKEILRALKPGGLNFYTVRNTTGMRITKQEFTEARICGKSAEVL